MKKKFLTGVAMLGALAIVATGCGAARSDGGDSGSGGDTIKVGFAQTGSESRLAQREHRVDEGRRSPTENGFDLVFNAADNDPAAQIAAVRSFINQGVDAIVIAPIVERRLGRRAQGGQGRRHPGDPRGPHRDLLRRPVRQLGRPGLQEGGRDGRHLGQPRQYGDTADQDGRARGHDRLGARQRPRRRASTRRSRAPRSRRSTRRPATSPATAARRSWRASCRSTASTASTWCTPTTTTWRSAPSRRSRRPAPSPATDIKIVSIDAVKDGMQALVDGKINYIVECNPLLGELAADLVKKVLAGEGRREGVLRRGPVLHAGAGRRGHRLTPVLIHG